MMIDGGTARDLTAGSVAGPPVTISDLQNESYRNQSARSDWDGLSGGAALGNLIGHGIHGIGHRASHASKPPRLIAELARRPGLRIVSLAWSSGLVVVARQH